ncbi:hypothetical protein LXL04_006131 [Taraxacum kok-saghyz]
MAFHVTMFLRGISSNTLDAFSTFPHLAYMSINEVATYMSWSRPFWNAYFSIDLPISRAPSDAHADRTPLNVMLLGKLVEEYEVEAMSWTLMERRWDLIWLKNSRPSFTIPPCTHADKTPTNVTSSGLTETDIRLNNNIASFALPLKA